MQQLLFDFPLSLFWGIILSWFLPRRWAPIAAVVVFSAAGLSLLLPGITSYLFWYPGGFFPILLGTLLALLLSGDPGQGEILDIQLATRRQVRESLQHIPDLEEKQRIYLNYVRETSSKLARKSDLILKKSGIQLLILTGIVFLCNFLVMIWLYHRQPEFRGGFETSLVNLNEAMKLKLTAEQQKTLLQAFFDFSPVLVFLQTVISQLFLLRFAARIRKYRGREPINFGELLFFKLPESSIFLVIMSGGIWAFSLYRELPSYLVLPAINAFLILLILYALQGLSILAVYLQVRLLPATWILLILLLIGMILPFILAGILLVVLFLGLLDFRADFRKKALQPALIRNSGL